MIRQLAICVMVAGFVTLSSRPAAAYPVDIRYDTIDAVEAAGATAITVTGIISGDGSPSTRTYGLLFSTPDISSRCERFALLAISKPGKFEFAIVNHGSYFTCKIIARTP